MPTSFSSGIVTRLTLLSFFAPLLCALRFASRRRSYVAPSLPVQAGWFTLVELLVVIAIIGILVAMLLPAVQAAREAARRTQCFNNLKQVGLAIHNYHDTLLTFPSGWVASDPATNRPHVEGHPGWGWNSLILPYMEQQNLHRSIDFNRAVIDPVNRAALNTELKTLRCPSDVGDGVFALPAEAGGVLMHMATSNYVGNFGTTELEDYEGAAIGVIGRGNGFFHHNSRLRMADILDGTSNTLAVGERASRRGYSTWGESPSAEKKPSRASWRLPITRRTTNTAISTISPASIPTERTSSLATAPSGCSRIRSTCRSIKPWPPVAAGKSTCPLIDPAALTLL